MIIGPQYKIKQVMKVAGGRVGGRGYRAAGDSIKAALLDCPGAHLIIGYDYDFRRGGLGCHICSPRAATAEHERIAALKAEQPKAVRIRPVPPAAAQSDQIGDVLRVLTTIAERMSTLSARVESLEDVQTRPNGAAGPMEAVVAQS